MPIPCPVEVRNVLADFHKRIRNIVDGAWDEWRDLPYNGRFIFQARARAVIVFDFIARRAQEEFDGDPNIKVLVKKQTVHFLFKNSVLGRFKKGNGKGIGSNIVTQEVLDFIDPQRNIPGLIPDIMKVEFCYKIDDMGFDLENLEVVARNEHSRLSLLFQKIDIGNFDRYIRHAAVLSEL